MNEIKKNRGLTVSQIKKAVLNSNLITKNASKSVIGVNLRPEKVLRKVQTQDLGFLLNLPYHCDQSFRKIPTPEWFESNKKKDISIIIPILNNGIEDFINNWDLNCENLKYELIFIDDNFLKDPRNEIISLWQSRISEIDKPIGKIYSSSINQGWNACCNYGSHVANGNILIFLDHRGKTSESCFSELIKLTKKRNVGIVAGLHIDQNNCIIESGREWSWSENAFQLIGSESYNKSSLTKPFNLNNIPNDLLETSEKEVVSSSLMAIDKQLFLDVGRFSQNLYNKNWSDADFCLSIREKDLKILIEPKSKIYFSKLEQNKSKEKQGSTYFYNKWNISGRMDLLVENSRIQDKENVLNVLIKRNGSYEDVLIAAAIAPALKNKYPNCKVIFATNHDKILHNNPWIDKVVEECSERHFNLICDLDMVYECKPDTSIITNFANVANVNVNECKMFIHKEVPNIELPETYVVIHAGKTMWVGKNWSSLKFDEVSKLLNKENIKMICVGDKNDHKVEYCDLDLRGKLSVHELSHVIDNCKMYIGIESFEMYVSQVFKKPGVCFFGSIKPETKLIDPNMIPVFADGIKCLGCHHRKPRPCILTSVCEVGVEECINGVSTERMMKYINKILKNQLNI